MPSYDVEKILEELSKATQEEYKIVEQVIHERIDVYVLQTDETQKILYVNFEEGKPSTYELAHTEVDEETGEEREVVEQVGTVKGE